MSTFIRKSQPPWMPPHCPNPNCKHHRRLPCGWRFRRMGYYRRKIRPYVISRYQCLHCGRSFSTQTFSTTYWLKRPQLLPKIFKLTVGGMANRQIARALDCAPSTVDTLLSRLGRHCLLYQRQITEHASPAVDIAIDGLGCFEHSQYFPFEHLLAVDRPTSFIPYFTDAPLRRSGRMTTRQKRKRERLERRLGRPDPKAVEKGMREVLEVALEGSERATVYSDKHRAYLRSIQGLKTDIDHKRTSSRAVRDRHNDLFEINSLDMFIRHSGANHRRETIAFSKRRQGSSERLAVFVVWKNFVKRRWEKGCRQTPGMLRGLTDRVLTVEEILSKRLFPSLIELPARWNDYYWRRVVTPVLGVNRRHELKYAV